MRKPDLSSLGAVVIGYLSVSCAARGIHDSYNRMYPSFFNGVDLTGWTASDGCRSADDGRIVGRAG